MNQRFRFGISADGKNEILEKIFTAIIVLMMWGYAYVVPFFPSLNFGEVMAICAMACAVFIRKPSIRISYTLLAFFAVSVLSTAIISLCLGSISDALMRMVRDAFYWGLILVFVCNYLDYAFFKKCLKIFCIVLSAVLVLQVVIYHLTGVFVPAYLFSGMVDSATSGRDIYEHILFWIGHSGYLKPYGILSEAAHCSQALFIGSLFLIHEYKEEGKTQTLWLLVLYNAASVLTFSASALIFSGIVFVSLMYLLFRKKKFAYFAFGALLVLGAIGLLTAYAGLDSIINRIFSAAAGGGEDTSAFVRIYKGFIYWASLPWVNKIFGIGFGNYTVFNEAYHIPISVDAASEFMSSMSYILVSTGVLGFIIFVLFFAKLFKQGNGLGRLLIIGLAVMSLAASIYSSPYWVWFMTGILFNQKNNEVKI